MNKHFKIYFSFFTLVFLLLFHFQSYSQNLNIAKLIHDAFETDGFKDMYLFDKAEKLYNEALNVDSTKMEAAKGIAILYHNYISFNENYLIENEKSLTKKQKKEIKATISAYRKRIEKY